MKNTALLIGYNTDGQVVYMERLTTYQFYDGEQVWDRDEAVRDLNLVRLIGELYDDDGNVYQSFETRFCAETGDFVSSKSFHRDGTITEYDHVPR